MDCYGLICLATSCTILSCAPSCSARYTSSSFATTSTVLCFNILLRLDICATLWFIYFSFVLLWSSGHFALFKRITKADSKSGIRLLSRFLARPCCRVITLWRAKNSQPVRHCTLTNLVSSLCFSLRDDTKSLQWSSASSSVSASLADGTSGVLGTTAGPVSPPYYQQGPSREVLELRAAAWFQAGIPR